MGYAETRPCVLRPSQEESLSSALGPAFKSGDRPDPGTRAPISMVDTKLIYRALWIRRSGRVN